MKFFEVPEDVGHVNEITGETFKIDGRESTSMYQFLMNVPLNDAKHFGVGLEALDARAEVIEAIKRHRPDGPDGPARIVVAGDKVGIPDKGHTILMAAINKPTSEFNPIAAGLFRRFMHAVRDAKDSLEALAPKV